LKHVEPIRSTIKYQVASSWIFDSSGLIAFIFRVKNFKERYEERERERERRGREIILFRLLDPEKDGTTILRNVG